MAFLKGTVDEDTYSSTCSLCMHEHGLVWQVFVEVDDKLEVDPCFISLVLTVPRPRWVRPLIQIDRTVLCPGGPAVLPFPKYSRHDHYRTVPYGLYLH
jgi:hypothetical protein